MHGRFASDDFEEAAGRQPEDFPTTFFINARPNTELTEALDAFRWEYERRHGPTDPTRTYATQLETAVQRSLSIKEWLRGSPPFVQAFFQQRWAALAEQGRLDDVGDAIVEFIAQKARPRGKGSAGRLGPEP